MGFCKPGSTCLYHGSDVPDANTTILTRTAPPGPVPIPYPNTAEVEEVTIDFFDFEVKIHAEPKLKQHIGVLVLDIEEESNPVIEACKHNWKKNKGDCNHFLKAVENELGYKDFGPDDNADAIVAIMEKSTNFKRLEGAKEAKQMADEGRLVIAGLRGKDQANPNKHGHVAVVISAPLQNGAPVGYWGSLGGTPKQNSSLRWAWTAADIKNVEYFARK